MQDAVRGALSGVHGPVSKLIRVEDRYTTAIETALGAAMQNIVVDDESCGKAAIGMLKRRDGGRATFLPLSTVTGRKLSEPQLVSMPGYVGVASELAQTDARYQGILENLLGRTVIAETLDHAIAMARKTGNRVRIVTLDGQVMNPGGSMTGGSSAKARAFCQEPTSSSGWSRSKRRFPMHRPRVRSAFRTRRASWPKRNMSLKISVRSSARQKTRSCAAQRSRSRWSCC